MAERRKNRKKKEHLELPPDNGKPSKDEYAVAKYLRKNLPEKKTMFLGHKVEYFIASKAINCLLDSPWATKNPSNEICFTNRESVVMFMDRMLQHKFFHRAKKIVVSKEVKKRKKDTDDTAESTKENKKSKSSDDVEEKSKQKEKEDKSKKKQKPEEKSKEKMEGKKKEEKSKEKVKEEKSKEKVKEEKSKDKVKEEKSKEKVKGKEKADEKKEKEEEEEKEKDETKEGDSSEKKKDKKKFKLDMHLEQLFLDGSEVFVWIYDPIPLRTWINGMLMVAGAVLLCLFPLWPQVIRHYIYYLSIAAALFLVFIIGLAIIRLIVFVIIWAFTLGKHHFWLLPNLTEDVGFFESFWPLYQYEYKGSKKEGDKKGKESKKDKSKEEDEEEEEEDNNKEEDEKSESSSDQEKKEGDQAEEDNNSESEKDSGDETKTLNSDNGFELLNAEEDELKKDL